MQIAAATFKGVTKQARGGPEKMKGEKMLKQGVSPRLKC